MGYVAEQSTLPENSRGTGAEDDLQLTANYAGHMAADIDLEVAHVLFMDVVGYSKLLINDQTEVLAQSNQVVHATAHFQKAEAEGKLIRLVTGDGMAVIFFNNAEAPVKCAMEIGQALQSYPSIQLRMGVHSGPIKS